MNEQIIKGINIKCAGRNMGKKGRNIKLNRIQINGTGIVRKRERMNRK
jgi:hypothetical protein